MLLEENCMLESLKKQVVEVAKEADRLGMCKHKSGNFSIIDPKTGCVVITPSGVAREILNIDHVCVLDLDANVIERKTEKKPSSEALMHLSVYKLRSDVRAIVHTHARYSTAFAVLNKELPSIVYECSYLGKSGKVPVAPYGRPGTPELAMNVAKTLRNADCCLMESHGAIAIGASMKDAFLKAQYVEEIAEVYYIALAANGFREPHFLPQEELQKWAYPKEIKFSK
jgi:L-ribulose-5-phosphate 4-epimerase